MNSFGAANELVRKFPVTGNCEILVIDLLDVPKVDGSAAVARPGAPAGR